MLGYKHLKAAIDLVEVKFLKEKLLIDKRYMDADCRRIELYEGALILCNFITTISKNFLVEVYRIEPDFN